MSPTLLFAHGWALDRTLWDKVLEALGDVAEGAQIRNAGYYRSPLPLDGGEAGRGGDGSAAVRPTGHPHPQPFPHQGGRESILGIGQSLGALELLAEPPPGLVGVVALDGFARFGRAADFPQGVPGRVLARMKARIGDGTLAEFVERAGGELPQGQPDPERLIEGLERLHTLDGRACRLPVWRLHADQDPIASLAMADASFAGMNIVERRIRQSTDHLSPLTAPNACAELIQSALKALS